MTGYKVKPRCGHKYKGNECVRTKGHGGKCASTDGVRWRGPKKEVKG